MDPDTALKYKVMEKTINHAYYSLVRLKKQDKLLSSLPLEEGYYPTPLDEHIAKLCGYKDADDMALNFRDETLQTFKLLADPDKAYVIYKTLEARLK